MGLTEDFSDGYSTGFGLNFGKDEELALPWDESTPTVSVEIPEPLARLIDATAEAFAIEPSRVVYEAVATQIVTVSGNVLRGYPIGEQLAFFLEHTRNRSEHYPAKVPAEPWAPQLRDNTP